MTLSMLQAVNCFYVPCAKANKSCRMMQKTHLAKEGCHKTGLPRADAPHDSDQLRRAIAETDVVQPPRGCTLLLIALLCCYIICLCQLLQRHRGEGVIVVVVGLPASLLT